MPAGRPSSYTEKKTDEICALIAQGKSVLEISKRKDMPVKDTIYKWLARYPEFAEKYTRARECQSEVYAQDILNIADASTPETYQVDRLRIDARKWKASKLAPKKWGDRLDVNATVASTVVLNPDADEL